ncbi:MAG TPA: phosphoribosylglycinamide formyltransferase, partial [Kofleriaceae bacterium]|nr:phosphoribosylglycinamide formyltransferase [Kofleriaceae bacterium]
MRIGVLASGRGSNLRALVAARDRGVLAPAELGLVVANRPGAPALEHARAAGLPAVLIDHAAYPDRQ